MWPSTGQQQNLHHIQLSRSNKTNKLFKETPQKSSESILAFALLNSLNQPIKYEIKKITF